MPSLMLYNKRSLLSVDRFRVVENLRLIVGGEALDAQYGDLVTVRESNPDLLSSCKYEAM